MRNKFFGKALIVCLLLTLFSCSGEIKVERNAEGILPPAIPTISGYKQRIVKMPSGTLYEIITPRDTFLIFGVYDMGMQVLKRTPIK